MIETLPESDEMNIIEVSIMKIDAISTMGMTMKEMNIIEISIIQIDIISTMKEKTIIIIQP